MDHKKEALIITKDGQIIQGLENTDTETHDEIIYRMFKKTIDSLSPELLLTIKSQTKLEYFDEFQLKNAIIVSLYLESMVILDNVEWSTVIIPPILTQNQTQYYIDEYTTTQRFLTAFYFEDGIKEINDFLNKDVTKEKIINKIMEIYCLGHNMSKGK